MSRNRVLGAACALLLLIACGADAQVWLTITEPPSSLTETGGSLDFTTALVVASWDRAPAALDLTVSYDPDQVRPVSFSWATGSPFAQNGAAHWVEGSGQVRIASFQTASSAPSTPGDVIALLGWRFTAAPASPVQLQVSPRGVVDCAWRPVEVTAYQAPGPDSAFWDLNCYHWAFWHINACYASGIVSGYPDGSFQPALPVSRDAMAVFVSRGMAGGDARVPTAPPTATFADVPTDHWAFQYVEFAARTHVVDGYPDGTYQPAHPVTRDQMAVFIARAMAGGDSYVPAGPLLADFPDVPAGHWAFKYVEYIHGQEVAGGYPDGLYHPEIVVTRDQMTVFMQRAFGLPL